MSSEYAWQSAEVSAKEAIAITTQFPGEELLRCRKSAISEHYDRSAREDVAQFGFAAVCGEPSFVRISEQRSSVSLVPIR